MPIDPVFIVGSPRSGTSILTWCLGQHPNLPGLEESNWMTSFAADVAVAHRRGSARSERSQFSSMGIGRAQLMRDLGACINRSIIAHRSAFEELARRQARLDASEIDEAFQIARSEFDPKARWIDGTPEYSLGIAGLRKLFPDARFIHLLRNCDDVAWSMVRLDQLSGLKLVANEEEAYKLWMQFVRACIEAEEAYGPEVVCRLLYVDLVGEPEKSMRRVLNFIGEPFDRRCLEPLGKRINSSRTAIEPGPSNPPVDSAIAQEARELWVRIKKVPPPTRPLPEVAERLEEQFEQRVDYVYDLDACHEETQNIYRKLEEDFSERTEWALRLKREVDQKDEQILQLQEEFADRTEWALSLAEENAQKDALILKLQKLIEERTA